MFGVLSDALFDVFLALLLLGAFHVDWLMHSSCMADAFLDVASALLVFWCISSALFDAF